MWLTLLHNQNIILSLRNHLCHTFSCGCLVAYKYMSSDKAAIDEMVVNTVFFCHCYVMPRIWYLIVVILFTQTKSLDQLVRVTFDRCFWRLSKRKPKELTKIANRNSTMTNSPVTKQQLMRWWSIQFSFAIVMLCQESDTWYLSFYLHRQKFWIN